MLSLLDVVETVGYLGRGVPCWDAAVSGVLTWGGSVTRLERGGELCLGAGSSALPFSDCAQCAMLLGNFVRDCEGS